MRTLAVAAVLALSVPLLPGRALAQAVPVTEVIFANGEGGQNSPSAMKTALLDFLQSATTSIDIAGYSIADADVIARLNEKSPAVTVRVVTDASNLGTLGGLEAGITVRNDGADPDEMHHKFIVVDGTAVWTGSANFTLRNFTVMQNNAVIVRSSTIATAYRNEFNRMFTSNQFKENKVGVLTASDSVGGQAVECRFAPSDSVANRIIELLNGADSSIYFAAFTFNHRGNQGVLDGIADAMRDRAMTGLVTLRGAFDANQASDANFTKFDELNALEPGPAANIDVRTTLSGANAEMHHKFIVIDRSIVITGSFNFTVAADEQNDENVVIISDFAIADRYIQELNRLLGTNFENLGENDPNVTTVSGAGSGSGLGDTTGAAASAAGGAGDPIAFPNPFRPSQGAMTIRTTTGATFGEVRIFTLDGRHVKTIRVPANSTSTTWDGRNDFGQGVASGTYVYELDASDGRLVGRVTVVR